MVCKIFSFEKSLFGNEAQSSISMFLTKKKNMIKKWVIKLTLNIQLLVEWYTVKANSMKSLDNDFIRFDSFYPRGSEFY